MALHLWCLFLKSEYLICVPNLLWRLETPDLPIAHLSINGVMYVMMLVSEGFALWGAALTCCLFQDGFSNGVVLQICRWESQLIVNGHL